MVRCSDVHCSTIQIPICDNKESGWHCVVKGYISRGISHEQKEYVVSVQNNNTTAVGM